MHTFSPVFICDCGP